jgi:uncharacterized integral membrane protein
MTDEQRPPAEETRFRRGLRYTGEVWFYVSLIALVVTIVYLILLISQNTRRVKVDYVFGSGNARVVWLILISALAGWVLGLATSFLLRRRHRGAR